MQAGKGGIPACRLCNNPTKPLLTTQDLPLRSEKRISKPIAAC